MTPHPAPDLLQINGNKDVISPLEKFPTYEEDEWHAPPGNVFRQTQPVSQDPTQYS
jgi:hypothetical protein